YNRFGHIIEIVPPLANGKPDHGATVCDWGFFLLGGNPADPSHGARYGGPVSEDGWLAAPDNVAFDAKGRLWIATDGQDDWVGFNDPLYATDVSGPDRGITRAFFTGPRGSEITGPHSRPTERRSSSPCSTRATRRAPRSRNPRRAGPTSARTRRRVPRCSP